jgi:hypothetical protein
MGFWNAFKEEYHANRRAEVQPEPPRMHKATCSEQLEELEELREDNLELAARVLERDEQVAEAKLLIEELLAEVRRLSNELNVRRRAAPPPPTAATEKYNELRRYARKHVHPDVAGDDKRLRALLGPICAELNAEIDRIDAA